MSAGKLKDLHSSGDHTQILEAFAKHISIVSFKFAQLPGHLYQQ